MAPAASSPESGFRNTDPGHTNNGWPLVFKWLILDRLTGRRDRRPPGPPAPTVEPDYDRIRCANPATQLTWLGHAGVLGSLAGTRFLVDPVFSDRIARWIPRHGPAPVDPDRIPRIDLLLVTHNHYDHLDEASVTVLSRDVAVVVPLALGRWFRRRGFRNVAELDWWQSVRVRDLDVTLVPARHWSRRTPWDTNRSLWGGFVLRGDDRTIYHAGDSARFDGFAEIGARFPGIDVAMLPIGAYEPAWFMEKHHLNPEQAGAAFLDLGARRMLPIHWGCFKLTDEPLAEPLERLRVWWARERPDGELLTPAVGETLGVAGPT